jgi:hypothetical protein
MMRWGYGTEQYKEGKHVVGQTADDGCEEQRKGRLSRLRPGPALSSEHNIGSGVRTFIDRRRNPNW